MAKPTLCQHWTGIHQAPIANRTSNRTPSKTQPAFAIYCIVSKINPIGTRAV